MFITILVPVFSKFLAVTFFWVNLVSKSATELHYMLITTFMFLFSEVLSFMSSWETWVPKSDVVLIDWNE